MKRIALLASFVLLTAVDAKAEPLTNPIRYTWIVSSCETWNCAMSALVLANGDKYVITVPTGREERPWLVLRRVEEGSLYLPDSEPFRCDVFDTVTTASSHLAAMSACHSPAILSVPDGRTVVTSIKDCGTKAGKRRAVR